MTTKQSILPQTLKIAKDTLKMPKAMLGVMGGPSRSEACAILNAHLGTHWNEDECEQIAHGLCVFQTKFGTPWDAYCTKKAGRGWYCTEHARDLKEMGATEAQLGRKR